MKFTIGQGTKASTIEGPFAICASRADFELLRDNIQELLNDPGNGCGISYGWLQVRPPQPAAFVATIASSEPWDA